MKTTKQAKITATSTPNFYDVESSNEWDHYPLILTAPGACRCGCPAGEAGRACYHRVTALATLTYVQEDSLVSELSLRRIAKAEREYWEGLTNRIEDAAELAAVEELFGGDAA